MKKKIAIEETFALALQNHKKNKLQIAENLYKKVLKINPNHFESIFFLGTLFAQFRKFNMAIKLLNKVIKIKPDYIHAHINLGNTFKELKKYEKSISCYERAIQINPNLSLAYGNLGIVFKELGKYQKAATYYEKAIQIDPNNVFIHNKLGILFGELKEFQKAQSHCEKAIQIDPNYTAAYYNLGLVLQELGEHQKAVNCYKKVIKMQTNHANSHNNLGIIFQELGEFSEAISCYQKALKYESENLNFLYHLSDLNEKILNSKLKNKISKIMKSANCTQRNSAYGNFLLAKYELHKKNYKKVFNFLTKGHKCYFDSKSTKFNKEINYCLNELPKINELVNTNQINKNIKKAPYNISPIFIVGVPRCGSTLVEKVIASGTNHIPIGEELGIFSALVRQKIYQKQDFNSDITNFQTQLIKSYEQKGLIQEKNNYTFTDKSLDNFFNIGLIHKIFPYAKVIDCRRNPLSSIMSILKNILIEISWAHNIEHIFKYFDIYYETIRNYKKIFPNFIYELQFEKFVSNPEMESKKLMNFCGLLWDKKCLEFYKRKDLISKTKSNIQIRQAIYKDSVDKYLPYKQFLNKYGNKYSWFN